MQSPCRPAWGAGSRPYFVPSVSRDGRHPGVPAALACRLAGETRASERAADAHAMPRRPRARRNWLYALPCEVTNICSYLCPGRPAQGLRCPHKMSDGLYALLGVLVGAASTGTVQALLDTRARRRAARVSARLVLNALEEYDLIVRELRAKGSWPAIRSGSKSSRPSRQRGLSISTCSQRCGASRSGLTYRTLSGTPRTSSWLWPT